MKRKLILCFIYNHFSRFYEKQLEDEARCHRTGKELVGLIPALHGVLWPVRDIQGRRPSLVAALPLEKAEKQQGKEFRPYRKSRSPVLSSKLGKQHILTNAY